MSSQKLKYTDPWYSKPGFVYFLAAGNPAKAIKIGVTVASRFESRLREHQSSNHEPLRVPGVIDFTEVGKGMRGAEQLEQSLHKQFARHQRFQAWWAGCEWFNPDPEILEYVHAHCSPAERFGLPVSVAKPGPGMTV